MDAEIDESSAQSSNAISINREWHIGFEAAKNGADPHNNPHSSQSSSRIAFVEWFTGWCAYTQAKEKEDERLCAEIEALMFNR